MASPAPRSKPLIPPKALMWLGIAFAIGLLLFLLLWLDQRNDTEFFRAGPASDRGGQVDNLPTPLPPDLAGSDSGNASGLRLPTGDDTLPQRQADAAEQPRIIDEPVAPSAAPTVPTTPIGPISSRDVAAPVPVSRPAPRYPQEALRRNQGGTVKIRVTVASDGSADRLELAEGSGNRHLDRAALEAVRRWTFQPATRNGQPVSAQVVVPIVFDAGR